MKWEEIDYFLNILNFTEDSKILDIWCGNWRFLWALKNKFPDIAVENYSWIDVSSWLLEEAKKLHPEFSDNFSQLDMLDINSPLLTREGVRGWDSIFFVASFHHLSCFEDRLQVLKKAKQLLLPGWKIYMTNWALDSELNYERYKKSVIQSPLLTMKGASGWVSTDYSIKIGWFERYYHCFDLQELAYLAEKNNFTIIENRLFDNERNMITILEK